MPAALLDHSFYARCPKTVARELLGKIIVSTIGNERSAGIVVETEAYLADGDTACHGFRGQTNKNRSMFQSAGRAYVYSIHAKYCFNTVTEQAGRPSAVLIRAIEPLVGQAIMSRRRGKPDERELGSGPAKLCQALGIDQSVDGWNLTRRRRLWLVDNPEFDSASRIKATQRIGVTSAKSLKLRFVLADHPFASGPKYLR